MPDSALRSAPPIGGAIVILLALIAGLAVSPAHAAAQVTVADPLAEPPLAAARRSAPGVVEIDLVAAPARLPLLRGSATEVYAYNGSVPGPTLELREGDRVTIRFRNELPEPTTVHWHGLHLPYEADGSPMHPVAPGETYEYSFHVQQGTAGTYWYHPHPHHRTAWQVGKGLYGALIVRAEDDPVPEAFGDKLLILSDNRFRADGELDFPDPSSPRGKVDAMNGREGDVLFVSGSVMPEITIRSGEVQRWRVINASGARIYRLALQDHSFLHIGSDGGLFERPVETAEILLANGERAELLVRGTGPPGTRALLQTLPYDRYMQQTRPADWDEPRDLLTLRYTPAPRVAAVAVPARLRHVPSLDPAAVTATRVMLMSQGRINSAVMDMNRVDVRTSLGATEIWEVENLVGMDHPFHLHGFRFQVLDRNGVPEPYASWKDTVNVPKRERVRFIVRYVDYPGKWMFHCHILDHEDQGMMGVLEVSGGEVPMH
jgi:FtsP/CotA-like multicopper oxidase with cupredoxin domain